MNNANSIGALVVLIIAVIIAMTTGTPLDVTFTIDTPSDAVALPDAATLSTDATSTEG